MNRAEHRVIDGGLAWDNTIAGLTIYDGDGVMAAQIRSHVLPVREGHIETQADRAVIANLVTDIGARLGLVKLGFVEGAFALMDTSTLERAADALNALIWVAEATHGAQETVERARAALREMATFISMGVSLADKQAKAIDSARAADAMQVKATVAMQVQRDALLTALRNIAGMCADQYPDAQAQIERIQLVAEEAARGVLS